MAKKDKEKLGNFDFDKSFDYDFDFGVDDANPPKVSGREAIMSVTKGVGSGAAETILSKNMLKKAIAGALPREYTTTFDFAEQSTGHLKDLYDTVGKELKPAVDASRRMAKVILPRVQGKVPKKFSALLEKIATGGERSAGAATEDRNASISKELDFFKLTAQKSIQDRAEDQFKADTRDQIEQLRHNNIMGYMKELTTAALKSRAYEENITLNYQRKSLELQYRSFYASLDLLEDSKKFHQKAVEELQGIKINAGLPEIQKLTKAESAKEILRNRFIGGVVDSIAGKRSAFMNKFVENLKNRATSSIRDFTGGFGTMADMADQISSMSQMTDGMSQADKLNMAGSFAGGGATDLLLNESFFGKMGAKLGRSWLGKYIRKGAAGAGVFNSNKESMLKDWSRTSKHEDHALGWLVRAIKDAVPSLTPDYSVSRFSNKDLYKPGVITNAFTRSVTDVIPGYLAALVREVQILRTGNEDISLMKFDHESGEFKSQKSFRKSLFDKIVKKSDYAQTGMVKMLDEIDPEKTLDEATRKEILRQLLIDNFQGRGGLTTRITGATSLSPEMRKLQPLMASYFGEKGYRESSTVQMERRQRFSKAFEEQGEYITPEMELIQSLINSGHTDDLKAMGLLDKDGNFDSAAYLAYAAGNRSFDPGSDSLVSGINGKPVRNRHITVNKNINTQSTTNQYTYGRVGKAPRENTDYAPPSETYNYSRDDFFHKTTAQLDELKALMAQGFILAGGGGSGSTQEEKLRWYQKSIGSLIGNVASGAKYGARAMWRASSLATKAITGIGRTLASPILKAGKVVGNFAVNKFAGITDWATDIYIKGERQARLSFRKMRAGQYMDSVTKKPLTGWASLKDIKGDVIDIETGEIVLRLTELEEIQEKATGKLKAVLSAAVRHGREIKKKLFDLSGSFQRLAFGVARKGFGVATGLLKRVVAKDVYVLGETSPRLLAITMRAGGYADALDPSKTIWKPTSIRGAVIAKATGEVVLTEADLAKGIVDVNGKPFKTIVRKMVDGAMNVLSKGREMASKTMSFLRSGLGKAWKGVRSFFGQLGLTIVAGSDIVAVLNRIYDLLDARMPGKRKKIYGSPDDEDGIRDGSWQDKAKKKASELSDKVRSGIAGAKDKASQSGFFASIAGGLKSLFSKKKKDEDEEDEEDDESLLDKARDLLDMGADVSEVKDMLSRRKRRLGRKVKVKAGRLKGKAGRLMQKMGKPFTAMGRGAMGALEGAGGLLGGLGRGAAKGLGAAGTVGRAALGRLPLIGTLLGGGLLAKSWLGDGTLKDKLSDTGDIGGGILGGLAAGALAGAAFGGVGAVPGAIVGGLVGAWGGRKIAETGYEAFKTKKFSAQPIASNSIDALRMAQYGLRVDQTAQIASVKFLEFTCLGKIKGEDDNLTVDVKSIPTNQYFDAFGINQKSPEQIKKFTKWLALRFLPVYLAYIRAMRKNGEKGEPSSLSSTVAPATRAKIMADVHVPGSVYSILTSPFPATELMVSAKDIDVITASVMEKINKDAPGAKSSALKDKTNTGETSKETEQKNSELNRAMSEIGQEIQTGTVRDASGLMVKTGLKLISAGRGYGRERNDELDFVRWKAYGLTSLEEARVRSLVILEEVARPNLKFSPQAATWQGSIQAVVEKVGPMFGVPGVNSEIGGEFIKWFNNRFLPVYLTYASAVKLKTGEDDPRRGANKLREEDKAQIAREIKGAQSKGMLGSKSIWEMTSSPWHGYELNNDGSSVDGNIKRLSENRTPKLIAVDQDNKTKPVTQPGSTAKPMPTFANDRFKIDGAKNAITNASIARESGSIKSVGQTYEAGTGSGGKLDQLPMPESGGRNPKSRYMAFKPLFEAIAKMVGMDPDLLATVAGIESGFQAGAQAGTSSAGGIFQFIDDTWDYMVKKYGSQYGIGPNTSKFDPRANALMGALYLKENMGILKNRLKRNVTAADLYSAHFMGPEGAAQFLSADPNAIAANVFPKAASANRNVFYNPDSTPRTIADVYAYMNRRISQTNESFGIAGASTLAVNRQGTGKISTEGMFAAQNMPLASQPVSKEPPTRTGTSASDTILRDSVKPATPETAQTSAPAPASRAAASTTLGELSSKKSNAENAKAQAEANRALASEEVAKIQATLNDQATIQKQSYEVLVSIRDILAMANQVKVPTATSSSQSTAPSPAPTAPVSMRRSG